MKRYLLTLMLVLGNPILCLAQAESTIHEFPKGSVIAIFKNVSNYPGAEFPYPEPPGFFERLVVLNNGSVVVDTDRGRKIHSIATRNFTEVTILANNLHSVELREARDPAPYPQPSFPGFERKPCFIKPNYRGHMSVAKNDWQNKKWSEELREIWMEDGCDYQIHLRTVHDYDRMQIENLVTRLQTLAFELAKD